MDKLSVKTQIIETTSVNFVDDANQFCGIVSSNANGQLTVNNAPHGDLEFPHPIYNPDIIPPVTETTTINFIDSENVFCGNITAKDGHLFINDVLQGVNNSISPAVLNDGSIITKEVETTTLLIKDSNNNLNGGIGGKDGKLYINGNVQESVYGAYVKNGLFSISPSIDSNGNAWLLGEFSIQGMPVTLYNKYNEEVQTLQPTIATGVINYFVAHISSDGVSNCWIAKFEVNFTTYFGGFNQFSLIDSQGNFIFYRSFKGEMKFYDKNGYVFGELSNQNIQYSTFVAKYSPTGIFTPVNESSLDPNMWCSKTDAFNSSNVPVNIITYIAILDMKDNIIITSQTALTGKSIRVYDKKNVVIDQITLDNPQAALIIVKYASNGMKNDENSQRISWSAHLEGSQSSVFAIGTYQPIAINSKNDIIITGRYRNASPTPAVKAFTYDGQIGEDMPFSGLVTTQDIFILSLNENGLSSQSWRNTITSPGLIEDSNFVALDSDDNIIISARSAGNNIQVSINNTNNTSAFNYASNIKNICVVKYLSDGTPINYNTLRATDFIIGGVGNGSPNGNDNYGGLFLDSNNNIIVKGIYNGASLALFDNTNTQVKNVTRSGTTSGIGFLMKLDSNMENPYLTTFGSGSTGAIPFTGNMFPAFLNITSTGEIVVTGFYIGPDVVFYNDGDSSPALSFTNGSTGIPGYNGFVIKYDTSLKNCKVCRLISADRVNLVIPYLATLDSEDSIIAYVRYGGNDSSAINMDIFNFDNYTDTPDTTLENSGSRDMSIIKISNDPLKSWNARISGIDEETANYDNLELLRFSAINTDKYNNIYVTGVSLQGCKYYDSKNEPRYDVNVDVGSSSNFLARYPSRGY